MMIDEDKQAICDALCRALQLTVAGNDLISIEYKTYGPWTQRAVLRFRGGNTQEVKDADDEQYGDLMNRYCVDCPLNML